MPTDMEHAACANQRETDVKLFNSNYSTELPRSSIFSFLFRGLHAFFWPSGFTYVLPAQTIACTAFMCHADMHKTEVEVHRIVRLYLQRKWRHKQKACYKPHGQLRDYKINS